MAKRKTSKAPRRQPEGSRMQDSSRRRSLPALAHVRKKVLSLLDEACALQIECTHAGHRHGEDVNAAKVRMLDAVLAILNEVEKEEPEGNTDGQRAGE